jgi:hypothetical protein
MSTRDPDFSSLSTLDNDEPTMSAPSSKKRRESIGRLSTAKRRKESHDTNSEFCVVNASLVLSVPPVFAANPLVGVQEMLDSMVMRCFFVRRMCCCNLTNLLSDIIIHWKGLSCHIPILHLCKMLHTSNAIVPSSSAVLDLMRPYGVHG